MGQREQWMMPEHPWPGDAHHFANLFPAVSPVAMNRAFDAGWFFLLKAATIQARPRIIHQRSTLRAERLVSRVPDMAKQFNHGLHGQSLAV
jgi:hypothetical protein